MKCSGSFILGVVMTGLSVLMELFWIQTGSTALGVLSLILVFVASGAFARMIRPDYPSGNRALRKFLTVVGLEN